MGDLLTYNFPMKLHNALVRAGIENAWQVAQLSDRDLMHMRNIGKHWLQVIREAIPYEEPPFGFHREVCPQCQGKGMVLVKSDPPPPRPPKYLDERRSAIVRWRDEDRLTYKAIAEKLGVTIERVRQIDQNARHKMKFGFEPLPTTREP